MYMYTVVYISIIDYHYEQAVLGCFCAHCELKLTTVMLNQTHIMVSGIEIT